MSTLNARLAIAAVVLPMWIRTTAAEIAFTPGKQQECSATVSWHDGDGEHRESIPFLLFVPRGYDTSQEPWPLLLFLHGAGECGTGQLERVKIHGPPRQVESNPDFPFILVSPQCKPPKGENYAEAWNPAALMGLLDQVSQTLRVDANRVYVTGLSMGGYGTWRLVAKYPDRIAAAIPICGGGSKEQADRIKSVPIWCFHGAKDRVVELSQSEEMVEAVRQAGGDVRFTVYPDLQHDSWTVTYDDPAVYPWLLEHRLDSRP